jgi:hypothetical protein
VSLDIPIAGMCRGGPWNGKFYYHWAESFEVYRPSLEAFEETETLSILGEYKFHSGEWIWKAA